MSGMAKRLGFFTGLMIFASMLYFVGSKLHLLSLPYVYFISGVAVLHMVYSALRKTSNGGFKSGFKEFGHRMNSAITVIVLVPVYFIGIGFTSLIGKAAGKKFLNMNKRGQKPSFEGYNEPEAKKENMMNVGELDQKFFNKPRKGKLAFKIDIKKCSGGV